MQVIEWLNNHWYVYLAVAVFVIGIIIAIGLFFVTKKSTQEEKSIAKDRYVAPQQRISAQEASKQERIFQKIPAPPQQAKKDIVYTQLPPENVPAEIIYDKLPANEKVIYEKLPDVEQMAKDYYKANDRNATANFMREKTRG